MRWLRRIATSPVRFYQRWLSPFKPPMCRFSPTCSQYVIVAIERHGFVRGGALSCWRILRCHPFCKGGYDPVPPKEPHGRAACARTSDGSTSAASRSGDGASEPIPPPRAQPRA